MDDKQSRPRGQRGAAGLVSGWQSAITAHHFTPIKTTWQHLAVLCEKATTLGETDPDIERRARHDRLARYLAQRIARDILRQVGRR